MVLKITVAVLDQLVWNNGLGIQNNYDFYKNSISLTLVMVFFTPLIAFWPLFVCWRFFGVLPVPFSVIGLIFFTFEIQLSETTMPRCAQIEGGGTRGTFLLGNALSKISSWIAARNKVISAVITLMLQSFVCQILHHRPKMAGVEQGHFLTPNA